MAPIIDAEIVQGLPHETGGPSSEACRDDLAAFLREGQHRVEVIGLAASRPDLDMLAFAARSLAQSAGRIGAPALADHCYAVENAAASGDTELAVGLVVTVGERYEAARTALVEYLRSSFD